MIDACFCDLRGVGCFKLRRRAASADGRQKLSERQSTRGNTEALCFLLSVFSPNSVALVFYRIRSLGRPIAAVRLKALENATAAHLCREVIGLAFSGCPIVVVIKIVATKVMTQFVTYNQRK